MPLSPASCCPSLSAPRDDKDGRLTVSDSDADGAEGRQFDDPALELEYLRLQNEDLASALRAEQAANADLRKAVQVLEDENNSLREYMNDRLV